MESQSRFYVIGVGPGSREYLLPITEKIVETCDLLIGSRRALSLFSTTHKERVELPSHIEEIVSLIKENYRRRTIAILVSGDPGLYSLLRVINREFSPSEIEVIPGISSMQLVFARIGLPYEEAVIRSFHGRRIENLRELVENHKQVGLFTDFKNSPQFIASLLLKEGIRDKKVFIGSNLSYSDEQTFEGSLDEVLDEEEFSNAVMVIYDG